MFIFIWPFLVAIDCQAAHIELYRHTKDHTEIYSGKSISRGYIR